MYTWACVFKDWRLKKRLETSWSCNAYARNYWQKSMKSQLSTKLHDPIFYCPVTLHMVAYFTIQTATKGVLCTLSCCIQVSHWSNLLSTHKPPQGSPSSINVSTVWPASHACLSAFFFFSQSFFLYLCPFCPPALPVWDLFPLDGISHLSKAS